MYDYDDLCKIYEKVTLERDNNSDTTTFVVTIAPGKNYKIVYTQHPFKAPQIYVNDAQYKDFLQISSPKLKKYIPYCLFCDTFYNPHKWSVTNKTVEILREIENIKTLKHDVLLHHLCEQISPRKKLPAEILQHIMGFILPAKRIYFGGKKHCYVVGCCGGGRRLREKYAPEPPNYWQVG
jgi:hypothetical protein